MRRMRSRPAALALATVLGMSLIAGCATSEQSAGLGALTGALVGAGVGYAIDDSAEAVIIGGLAGALAGGIIGYIVGEKLEDRETTIANNPQIQEELAQPGVDEVLDIRRLRIDPETVMAGERVDVMVIHSYIGATDRLQPFDVEVQLVDCSGRVLLDESQRQEYENGTYSSTITLEMPSDLPPGRYGIDVAMRTGQVTDNASGLLTVS